jgi:cell division protein FtsX
MYVYLENGIAENVSRDIQFRILGMQGVEEVVYVSRSEALSSFRAALGEEGDILEALEDNPLPDAYRVKLKRRSRTTSRSRQRVSGTAESFRRGMTGNAGL